MKKKVLSTEEIRIEYDHLWNYFECHAVQRINTFKIFLVLASIVSTGAAAIILSKTEAKLPSGECKFLPDIPYIMIVSGLLLIIFSWIFWMLDNRNRKLIHSAEKKLIKMEKDGLFSYKIFETVEKDDKDSKSFKFSFCFRVIFLCFLIIGIFFAGYAIYKLCFN